MRWLLERDWVGRWQTITESSVSQEPRASKPPAGFLGGLGVFARNGFEAA
jgi:hypothetical protein